MANENLSCPVCGLELNTAAQPCGCCGFTRAGVRAFLSPEDWQTWQQQAAAQHPRWIGRVQKRLLPGVAGGPAAPVLTVGPSAVAVCAEGRGFLQDGVHPGTAAPGILQYSVGGRHTAALTDKGTVTAWGGGNDYGELNVQKLKNIVSVFAGQDCTYAVRRDGRVAVCGRPCMGANTELLPGDAVPVLRRWHKVVRLTGSGNHLVGLTAEGRVLIAGYPLRQQEEIDRQTAAYTDIVDIAAGDNYATLLLHRDGTVTFVGSAGPEPDPRAAAAGWKNITAVAADRNYAMGLTADGRVLLAGKCSRLLDLGRSAAADWKDIVCLTSGSGCLAAVDALGGLHLAGSIPRAKEIMEGWARDGQAVSSALVGR